MDSPRSALRWFAAAATTLVAVATLSAQPPDTPRPLDPLTARERRLADSVARTDPRLRDLFGTAAPLLVDVGFVAGKPRNARDIDAVGSRQAAVQYFVRARNVGVTALVDLAQGTVLDVARVRGTDVPLADAEVTRAARLALADDRVRRLFDGRLPAFRIGRDPGEAIDTAATRIDGIRLMGPKGDKCFERRCVALFFRVDNTYVQLGRVVVDLLTDAVMIRQGAR